MSVKRMTKVICAVAVGLACLAVGSTAHATNSLGGGNTDAGLGNAQDFANNYVTLMYTGDDLARLGYVTYGGRTFLAEVGQSDFYVYQAPKTHAGLGDAIAQASSSDTYKTTGYCIEVLKSIDPGASYVFGVEQLSLAPTLVNGDRSTDLEKLFALHAADVVDNDTAAAFAAAVWEIVNETAIRNGAPDYNVDKGSFTVRPVFGRRQDWDGVANGYLADVVNLDVVPSDAYALVSATAQDFAWLLPAPTLQAADAPLVPEPITLISGFLAASAIGFYTRRRAKAQA